MLSELDHESLRTALATVGGYGLILAAMTVLLFGVPFLIVTTFA